MELLKLVSIHCPYCGDPFDITVDCSIVDQQYIEDCYVCCRPIQLSISVDEDNNASVSARHENE